MPKIIQLMYTTNKGLWNGLLLGLGDDGVTYKASPSEGWVVCMESLENYAVRKLKASHSVKPISRECTTPVLSGQRLHDMLEGGWSVTKMDMPCGGKWAWVRKVEGHELHGGDIFGCVCHTTYRAIEAFINEEGTPWSV